MSGSNTPAAEGATWWQAPLMIRGQTEYHTLEQVGAPALPMVVALVPMSFGWAIGSFLVAARYR